MKREFLKAIAGLKDEDIDRIMAEAGKDVNSVKAELDTLKTTHAASTTELEAYKTRIAELEKSGADTAALKKQLDDLNVQIAADKTAAAAKAADEKLNADIITAFGEKKFVYDFTKNALISQIKDEMKSLKIKIRKSRICLKQ